MMALTLSCQPNIFSSSFHCRCQASTFMRPDEHKAKESRRYQARKKNQGDATAAQVAERRRQAAKARDSGNSIAAIRRRNGELPSLQQQRESAEAIAKARSSKFSKRKIVSNRDRYKEISVQG